MLLPVSSAHELPHDPREPAPSPDGLAEIRLALNGLAATMEREHQRAAHREAIIDRLHEDNQGLRRGELQAMFDPVRATLYRLYDLVRRESERWASSTPPDPAHCATLLAAVADEIAEALARTGVERFTVKPGDLFDATRHRPVATIAVADPALDAAVVSVQTDGFERGETIVRKAEVCVGRLAHDGFEGQGAT